MRMIAVIATAAAALLSFPVLADDWSVTRLRGGVVHLVNGEWEQLERGAVIPDSRVVRTVSGRVTLVRGEETIDLGPNTQIQIFDEAGRKPFTTVKQYFGRVEVEADVRDVQHFAVQTPYLVAVVKGTRFTVVSGLDKSVVRVTRGAVSVTEPSHGSQTTVGAGQSAAANNGEVLRVSGWGRLPEVTIGNGVVNGNGNGNAAGVGVGVGVGKGKGATVGVGIGNGTANGGGPAVSIGVANGNSNGGGNGGGAAVSIGVGSGNGGGNGGGPAVSVSLGTGGGGGGGVSVGLGFGKK